MKDYPSSQQTTTSSSSINCTYPAGAQAFHVVIFHLSMSSGTNCEPRKTKEKFDNTPTKGDSFNNLTSAIGAYGTSKL